MTAKHTPGPWTLINEDLRDEPYGSYETSICGFDGSRVTRVLDEDCDPKAAQANAHLIAAAPELLTMLTRLLGEVMISESIFGRLSSLTLEQASNVIKKAQGE